jgi:membrane-associated phospholipid phosphatase
MRRILRRVRFGPASLFLVSALIAPALAQTVNQQIEPQAGAWRTWVIPSGREFRVPPPPDAGATKGELQWLHGVVTENDPAIAYQVKFWDSGSPAYRWIDLVTTRFLAGQPVTAYPHRVYAYVALAIYDATVATWDSKYTYNRPRPSEADPTLRTALPVPRSPSYPSEHAAAASAAAEVLAYFFPSEAASFRSLAQEAARSRLYAGLQYPSDYFAGLELGRQVAARVIERAQADGSDAGWTGSVPTGPCMWTGTNPGNVTATGWRPLLLSSAAEFRPPAPPACTSPEVVAQVADVRNFPRSPAAFNTNYKAFYWQSPEGLQTWPYVFANKWIFEDKLDQNPPRAARAYALLAASFFDAFIASQDGKFAYWYLRPHQLDTAIVPLFPVPNFPSYPSNHSTFSATRSEILAYLFPGRADLVRAVGKEAGDSRIWAGIHYQMDNQSGVQLGRSVAQKFIAWANSDGSQ